MMHAGAGFVKRGAVPGRLARGFALDSPEQDFAHEPAADVDAFVGGPGTAMAWAQELEAQGLSGAQVVGVGAATLAAVPESCSA